MGEGVWESLPGRRDCGQPLFHCSIFSVFQNHHRSLSILKNKANVIFNISDSCGEPKTRKSDRARDFTVCQVPPRKTGGKLVCSGGTGLSEIKP